jgi:vacuolar-type H+-ATPase subunit H
MRNSMLSRSEALSEISEAEEEAYPNINNGMLQVQ